MMEDDFRKSWKSGLAFCAIIHRYRPELVGDYAQLDFTISSQGHKDNCRRAFDAAEMLGASRYCYSTQSFTGPQWEMVGFSGCWTRVRP